MTRASAVTFYAMLASVPFLAVLLTVAASLLPDLSGEERSTGIGNLTVSQLRETLERLVPDEAYPVVEEQIKRLQRPRVGLLSLGVAISIWTASSLFVSIMDAMNVIYGVSETRPLWKRRLVAIFMTLGQVVILLGALIAIVAGPWLMDWLGLGANVLAVLLATIFQWIVVFVMVALSFAWAFYVGPDAEQRWEWITLGSLAGTVIFLLASLGFRIYVQNFTSYADTYGSLGGVMILLFWLWISTLVLLIAAEMNRIIESASPLGKNPGQKIDPTDPPDFAAIPPQRWQGRVWDEPETLGDGVPMLLSPEPERMAV